MDNMTGFIPQESNKTNGFITLPRSEAQAITAIMDVCLSQIDTDNPPEPEQIADSILCMAEREFLRHNKYADPGTKHKIPHELPWYIIPDIMLKLHTIKNINCAGVNSEQDYDILGIYQESGKDEGTYIHNERLINNLIARYNKSINAVELKQVKSRLRDLAERVERCCDANLVAVNNGIFNRATKTLMPFHPDIVFTTKSRVDYNPNAKNVVIHNEDGTDWDIESWIKELSDDDGVPELIWQVIGAIIRPNTRWNKSAWLLSEQGNNGKGTLCHLMRNIAGEGAYASIQLSDFGKDFMLEPLIGATSIITDENDVGTCIDKAANLKAIITNDVIQINRKFKVPIAYQFRGFMVQCVNSIIQVKDTSESFYRRLLIIPFTKCYTGKERKYIKEDYLNRKDVLEYALHRILNMDYDQLNEPAACKNALGEHKISNDPIRDFLSDVLTQASWDCIPKNILFEMYKGWSRINNPNGTIPGRNMFFRNVDNIIGAGLYGWVTKKRTRVCRRMDGEECLLEQYGCKAYMRNPDSQNPTDRVTAKKIPQSVDGLFRVVKPAA